MTDLDKLVAHLGSGHVLENYIVPGLRSTLLANTVDGGKVRIFDMRREQEYEVTPHDHRYALRCHVLRGQVENRVYDVCEYVAEEYAAWAKLLYDPSTHELVGDPILCGGSIHSTTYVAGDWYSMTADDFHSIRFSRDARVLLIECPEEKRESYCLLPYSAGRICNTFLWEPWMMEGAP